MMGEWEIIPIKEYDKHRSWSARRAHPERADEGSVAGEVLLLAAESTAGRVYPVWLGNWSRKKRASTISMK